MKLIKITNQLITEIANLGDVQKAIRDKNIAAFTARGMLCPNQKKNEKRRVF